MEEGDTRGTVTSNWDVKSRVILRDFTRCVQVIHELPGILRRACSPTRPSPGAFVIRVPP